MVLDEKRGIFKSHEKIWVEKYRPANIDEYLGDKEIKEKFREYIAKGEIPNLLLCGYPGSGKSSYANIIVKTLDCDFKYINASDERNIDTVRTKITSFCQSAGFSPLKILVLDEADGQNPTAQFALKSITEQYTEHIRFIFTANEEEKIIDALKSRCQVFNMLPPTKDDVFRRCKYILENEKVIYDNDEVNAIINFSYPDLRKTIQALEQNTISGVLKMNKDYFRVLEYNRKVVSTLKSVNANNIHDKVTEIRQMLLDSKVKNFTQLFRYLFDKVDDYAPKSKVIKIIINLQEGLKYDPFIADKELNIIATLIRIAEILTE